MFLSDYTICSMTQKDPVCGMMVDEKKAQHISEANGQKIYLCSAGCKKTCSSSVQINSSISIVLLPIEFQTTGVVAIHRHYL
jgi:YHS domain-containing protein